MFPSIFKEQEAVELLQVEVEVPVGIVRLGIVKPLEEVEMQNLLYQW